MHLGKSAFGLNRPLQIGVPLQDNTLCVETGELQQDSYESYLQQTRVKAGLFLPGQGPTAL